ncbi:hypothetical protein [Alicyclobacillus sp.]|uniref:hypothetical protein n=1 Tax=Alicyclobacillus sp. TaxID=61169 RepID=UPI0025BAB7CC|nr:hypothetical protein [Alicyclobacillus sp.]MCL6515396.1 hypothetical protein [Alicyclobacillus sp.]
MRRYRLQMISLMLMWIGGIEVAASFLAKYWFHFDFRWTPYFFLALLVGIGMYMAAKLI